MSLVPKRPGGEGVPRITGDPATDTNFAYLLSRLAGADGQTPDVVAVLDQDGFEVYLQVLTKTQAARSLKWLAVVQAEGVEAPTIEDVRSSGTAAEVSGPEDRILVHTYAPDDVLLRTRLWVAFAAYSLPSGAGAEGPFHILEEQAAPETPELYFYPVTPSTTPSNYGREKVMIVVTDNGDQVALYTRLYELGATPGAFVRTPTNPAEFASDPLLHPYEVEKPAEGTPDQVLEAYAVDAAGNKSTTKTIRFDGNAIPSGWFEIEIDPTTREIFVTPQTDDADTGSWRLRLKVASVETETYEDPTFTDSPSDAEFSGGPTSFGVRVPTGLSANDTQAVYLSAFLFRTTSAAAADQSGSLRSPNVRTWRPFSHVAEASLALSLDSAGNVVAVWKGNIAAEGVYIEDDAAGYPGTAVEGASTATFPPTETGRVGETTLGGGALTPGTERWVRLWAHNAGGTYGPHAQARISGSGPGGVNTNPFCSILTNRWEEVGAWADQALDLRVRYDAAQVAQVVFDFIDGDGTVRQFRHTCDGSGLEWVRMKQSTGGADATWRPQQRFDAAGIEVEVIPVGTIGGSDFLGTWFVYTAVPFGVALNDGENAYASGNWKLGYGISVAEEAVVGEGPILKVGRPSMSISGSGGAVSLSLEETGINRFTASEPTVIALPSGVEDGVYIVVVDPGAHAVTLASGWRTQGGEQPAFSGRTILTVIVADGVCYAATTPEMEAI